MNRGRQAQLTYAIQPMLHPQRLFGLALGLLIAAWAIDVGRKHPTNTLPPLPVQTHAHR